MAKTQKKRKQNALSLEAKSETKKPKTELLPPPVIPQPDSNLVGNLIFEDELETTTETLSTLSKNPDLISLKALKPFRTAFHECWRVVNETSMTGTAY